MPMNELDRLFERIFKIMSHPSFLAREGLGNELPIFIQPYDIGHQETVYASIDGLCRRLDTAGVPTLLVSLYDVVLSVFEKKGQLERLFERESTVEKEDLKRHMAEMLSPGPVIAPEIRGRIDEASPRIVVLHQVGEVYPYLRTHDVLNNLHSIVETVPLVVFFPGEYVSSDSSGFYVSLFGKFRGDYYRAFHLDEYIQRGKIDVNA